MRTGNHFGIQAALVLFLALAQGCSSSQTSSEYTSDPLGVESSADAVGSIPEDMLSAEELPIESSVGASDALGTGEASASSGTETQAADAGAPPAEGSDPFADLVDGSSSSSADALGVAEAEDSSGGGSELSGTTDTYTVKAGDTLMKIAFTIYGNVDRWKDLHDWNRGKLRKASQLKPGMKLTYETPLNPFQPEQLANSYVIKQGDTLAGIADEVYGRKMKYRKLQRYNKTLIKDANRIFAGFTIYYDITQQEMAEAEERRRQRMAEGGGNIPSAIAPGVESAPMAPQQPIAVSPSQMVGPPAPGQ